MTDVDLKIINNNTRLQMIFIFKLPVYQNINYKIKLYNVKCAKILLHNIIYFVAQLSSLPKLTT